LEEFNVPAVFFISSNHVKYNKSFWWDVVYREGKQRQLSGVEIGRTIGGYKKLKTEDVERDLKKKYGAHALRPMTDMDRPFTPSELRAFSNHPLVSLGNHTKDHAILPNYSEAEIRRQICDAQIDPAAARN
jgi:peptidoglycan/xylan/chitin deacetylase (PgdA/CDA1 family)